MTTRSAKLYQGEDKAPVVDYTDAVIWEESEFGTRAHNGEGSASNVVIRDPLGETGSSVSLPSGLAFKTLPSKSLFLVEVDSSLLYRGRVGIKNYTRDGQHVERYRQVDVSLHDTHWDLDHIFVHGYSRPAETDVARTQGIIASYLSGNGRPTTVLNGSNYISASNPVTLPAQTYNRTSPLGMLREIAISANKQFFETADTIGGGSLFWDGNDSTAYACPFTISDRATEVAANPGTYFPPIWNVGPASSEDGSEQIDEVRYFYGSGDDSYVTVHSDVVHTQYGHASVTIYDDTAETAAEATVRAESVLSHRRREDRTYNVTIGPLTDAQVVQIKHGMTIPIKARAIPDADDAFQTMRIGQCRYTTPVAGTWFAHLQLGRPWKMQAYSVGDKSGTIKPDIYQDDSPCIETYTRTTVSGVGTAEWPQGEVWEPTENTFFRVDGDELIIARPDPIPGYARHVSIPWGLGLPLEMIFTFRWEDGAATGDATFDRVGRAVLVLDNDTGDGGLIEPFSKPYETLEFRLQNPLGPYYTSVLVEGDGMGPSDDYTTGGLTGTPGLHTEVQKVRWRLEEDRVKLKLWDASDPEPAAWGYDFAKDVLASSYTRASLYPALVEDGSGGFATGCRLIFDSYEVVEPCDGHSEITGGPNASSGDPIGEQAASYNHDHDSVDNGDAAGGDLAGTYPNPTIPHITDTVDAHDASAVSADTTGFDNSTGDDVQEVLADFDAAITAGGGGGGGFDVSAMRDQTIVRDECFFISTTGVYEGAITEQASGAAAATSNAAPTGNHPGIINLAIGTATGRIGLGSSSTSGVALGGGTFRCGIVFKIFTALSDGTNTYTVRLGTGTSFTGEHASGVFFRYTDAVNSGKWEAVARNSGVETAIDTGVTADLNWHSFEYEVNAAGSSVEFFIDGASVGTVSTNLPTPGHRLIPANIIASAGTANRFFQLDAYWYIFDFTTAR